MAFPLLLEDAVGRSDEICSRLEQVDLLQRQVRLEERVLEKSMEVSRPVAGAEATGYGTRTLPKTSSGSPRYRIKLYLSLVRKLDGFSRR